jgi:N6-adenosine-specific RNA methylase IME4
MMVVPEMFTTLLLDPPWPENGGGKIKRGADKHYSTIKKKEEILRVIMQSGVYRPADDAHMWMWVTNNYLPWGLWLMEALGFRYVTNVPWTKAGRMGIGQYARGCHEILLFGVRGKGYAACRYDEETEKRHYIRTDSLVGIPRPGRHSQKPEEAYAMIEHLSAPPYLEMFSREIRPNWYSWGNEV